MAWYLSMREMFTDEPGLPGPAVTACMVVCVTEPGHDDHHHASDVKAVHN
jgi:hypothetical protein